MKNLTQTFCFIYYIACLVNGLLFLSSFGSMMDADAGPKLIRAIIAIIACPVLGFIGLVAASIATSRDSKSASRLWAATAVAAAPGILTLLAIGFSHR